jgi:hypothetical protein
VLGAPLPADEVAPLVVAARGSGRLALWEIEEGGRRVATLRGPSDAFADRDLRRDCTPMRTTTAGVRCVPTEVAYVEPPTSFADAACTRPVVAPRPAELVAIARPGHAAGLRTATELRRVGPHVGHELFRLREGRCEPDLARVPHWELGERVSWEGFAALEEWLGDERAP